MEIFRKRERNARDWRRTRWRDFCVFSLHWNICIKSARRATVRYVRTLDRAGSRGTIRERDSPGDWVSRRSQLFDSPAGQTRHAAPIASRRVASERINGRATRRIALVRTRVNVRGTRYRRCNFGKLTRSVTMQRRRRRNVAAIVCRLHNARNCDNNRAR